MSDAPVIKPKTERELRRQARRERAAKGQDLYGLTRSTQLFLAAIVVLLFMLVAGTITYLTLALNDARNVDRSQDIAISEWSRRYVSLYDQYSSQTGKKPTSLSPSAIDYLISTETSGPGAASAIPGLPTTNGVKSTVVPPGFKFKITTKGIVTNLTCAPTADYDPASPTYNCK